MLEEIVSCSEVSSMLYIYIMDQPYATSKPLITNSFSRVCRTHDVAADMVSMTFTSDVSKPPPVVEEWLGCYNA